MRVSQTAVGLMSLVAFAAACGEEPVVTNAEPPPAEECTLEVIPRNFEVYFVIDVSGSMSPFLNDLSQSLSRFALNFPDVDSQDQRVLVNYYVVAFVNDVRWFPTSSHRMTSVVAVQSAIRDAIHAGESGQNLNQAGSINAEVDENLLDALSEVIESDPPADAVKIVMVATDAAFREAPDLLSVGLQVRSNFGTVRAGLETMGAQVHVFTPDALDGLTRSYREIPALAALPKSSQNSLNDLATAEDLLGQRLAEIAQGAACK